MGFKIRGKARGKSRSLPRTPTERKNNTKIIATCPIPWNLGQSHSIDVFSMNWVCSLTRRLIHPVWTVNHFNWLQWKCLSCGTTTCFLSILGHISGQSITNKPRIIKKMDQNYIKSMGFCPRKCVGYGVSQIYGFLKAFWVGYHLGEHENVWGFTDYGLCQLWVKTALTVDTGWNTAAFWHCISLPYWELISEVLNDRHGASRRVSRIGRWMTEPWSAGFHGAWFGHSTVSSWSAKDPWVLGLGIISNPGCNLRYQFKGGSGILKGACNSPKFLL